jgi:ureidoglycolate lyase
MRLVTVLHGSSPEVGALVDARRIVSLTAAGLAGTMIELIERWDDVRGQAEALVAGGGPFLPLDQVQLLAPIPRPPKILAIGLNYADHIAESGLGEPEHQLWFCKQPTSASGPYDPIDIPRVSSAVDYEAELVAVIGRGGRHIARSAAAEHVFGYCVGNDVSVRDWQLRTSQFMLGKSFDTHAPYGPWITTSDEVPDPHALGIRCYVNGEIRQDSNTSNLVFDLPAQIEHLSQALTLEPGDLLFTGTPGGVGWAMNPRKLLAAGDRVRCEIDGLGAIDNCCEAEAA